jgi:nickel-dependent lactate racemase
VLALDEGVPQVGPVADVVLEYLAQHGIALDGIAVLVTQADADRHLDYRQRHWPEAWQQQIRVTTHDPTDRGQMSYLATTQSGEAVWLNRALTDADVVLPIGCLEPSQAPGYFGLYGTLFPTFSSVKALARYRSPAALQIRGARRRRLVEDVEEVAWLLGVTFAMTVVPGGGDGVYDFLAGRPDAVSGEGSRRYHSAWKCSVPRRAHLVVAGVEGDAGQQTWRNVGRALAAASELVEEGGAIAICSDLEVQPGPALQCLAGAASHSEAMRWIRKERPGDTIAALQLAGALERNTVYLLSKLDGAVVERLDMAPIGSADELARLVHRAPSCIVLGNAPHARVSVDGE